MSAIITNKFRRQSRASFLKDIADAADDTNQAGYWIGLGKSDSWAADEDEYYYNVPLPNGSTIADQDSRDNLLALVKLANYSAIMTRNEWNSGRTYQVYDPHNPAMFDLDGHYYPCTMTYSNKVYVCLNNNDKSASTSAPTLSTFGVEKPVDGYIWAYVHDVYPADPFFTEEFIPVGPTLSSPADDAQLLAAKTATGGLVYNFEIVNGGTGIVGSHKVYLKGIDKDGVAITPIDLMADSRFDVNPNGGNITSITYPGTDYVTGYYKASVEVYDASGNRVSDVKITPLVAKLDGFGSNPLDELASFYVGCYAKFQGNVNGEALTNVPFRQISLIKNPEFVDNGDNGDTGVYYGAAEAADALSYIVLGTNEATQKLPAGAIIEQPSTGARAYLDKVDQVNDRLYYHQNSDHEVNYIPFDGTGGGPSVDNRIIVWPADGGDELQSFEEGDISGVERAEYTPNSGNVLFVDHRSKITRSNDQTEDIKIVIQF